MSLLINLRKGAIRSNGCIAPFSFPQMENRMTTIQVTDDSSYEHEVGDANCTSGWCGGWGYPRPCRCGGLIHADFLDEDCDNVLLSYKCDACLSTCNLD